MDGMIIEGHLLKRIIQATKGMFFVIHSLSFKKNIFQHPQSYNNIDVTEIE